MYESAENIKSYGGSVDYFKTEIDDSGYVFKRSIKNLHNAYKSGTTIPLGSLIMHSKLFKKYPLLNSVNVILGNILDERIGANSYVTHSNDTEAHLSTIFLNLHFDYYEQNKRELFELTGQYPEFSKEAVVLHEIQHLLQLSDGRGTGRSKESIFEEVSIGGRILGSSEKEIDYAANFQYKTQPSEQEAMKTVYKWLYQKGLEYEDAIFIDWSYEIRLYEQASKNKIEGAQEGIYAAGGSLAVKNTNGGYSYFYGELSRAKKVDLLTLPENVLGTNCGNCLFQSNGFCNHKEIRLPVTPRMCCALWDNVKAFRSWKANGGVAGCGCKGEIIVTETDFGRGGEITFENKLQEQIDEKIMSYQFGENIPQ